MTTATSTNRFALPLRDDFGHRRVAVRKPVWRRKDIFDLRLREAERAPCDLLKPIIFRGRRKDLIDREVCPVRTVSSDDQRSESKKHEQAKTSHHFPREF